MKIVAVQFDYPGTNRYNILSKVFEYSVKVNCPEAELEILKVKAPIIKGKVRSKSFASNTLKLDLWLDTLNNTEDNVVFMDCDMIVLKDISDAFNSDFDVGYTKRTGSRIPYNGGVVFVKNTQKAREFITLWKNINLKMYDDYVFHKPWRNKYGGMNQAAFGYIMEKENYRAKLKKFGCDIWNACDDNWKKLDDKTKVIHIKGTLRRNVLMDRQINTQYNRAMIVWKNLAIGAGVITGKNQVVDNIVVMEPHPLIRRVRGIKRRRKIV